MPRDERSRELARKRHRRAKLKKLRKKYATAKDRAERESIEEKVRKISPFAVLEESK
ncbi:MAG: DUF6800 family protein [Planctomycetaceae bacterium]